MDVQQVRFLKRVFSRSGRRRVYSKLDTSRRRVHGGNYYKRPDDWKPEPRSRESSRNRQELLGLAQIAKKQKFTCAHCDHKFTKDMKGITLDHITPIIQGGKHSVDNFQFLCFNCNQIKSILDRANK